LSLRQPPARLSAMICRTTAVSGRVDGLAVADGHRTGGLVVMPAGDDALRVGDDGAVVEETLTWSLAACKAQMLPSSTKQGRVVRLMVSVTPGSAACTRSRTWR